MKKTKIEQAIENFGKALKITLNVQEQDISNQITIADGWVALDALREALERAAGCEYCEEYSDDCDTASFHTRPDWRSMDDVLNDRNDCIPANYCPSCGRRLKGGGAG